MTPDRMKNLRAHIAEVRSKGARDDAHAYMAPVTLEELETLLDRTERYDERTAELLGQVNRYQQLWRDSKEALQAAVTLSEKAVSALSTINAVVDHQTNRVFEPTILHGTIIPMQVHPLTCGNNSSHTPLYPYWRADGKVVLRCRDCDYEQNNAGLFGR